MTSSIRMHQALIRNFLTLLQTEDTRHQCLTLLIWQQRALKDRFSSTSSSLHSEVTSPTPLLLLIPLLPGQEHQTCLGDASLRLMVSSGLYISSCFRWWICSVFSLMVSESSKATEVRITAYWPILIENKRKRINCCYDLKQSLKSKFNRKNELRSACLIHHHYKLPPGACRMLSHLSVYSASKWLWRALVVILLILLPWAEKQRLGKIRENIWHFPLK